MDPLVSVVIPSYNRAHVIAETLDSVLAQTYRNLEIIVVDDGSKDDTAGAVKPYLGKIVYLPQKNGGLASARNAGMARATGEYIAWLDSDDLWNPEKIAVQVAVMQRHPEVVLSATEFSAFDDQGYFDPAHARSYYSVIDRTTGGLGGIFPSVGKLDARHAGLPSTIPDHVRVYHGAIYDALINGNCLHPPTSLFRREAAHRAGPVEGRFRNDSDYEYFLRLSRLGAVAFVDLPLMKYRYSPDQMSSDKYLADIAWSRVLVMEALLAGDPSLVARHSFRKRLGSSYLAAAYTLAETKRAHALKHLVTSLGWRYVDKNTLKTVAKMMVPRWAMKLYRSRRAV